MSDTPVLTYSSLIVFKPSLKDWSIETLFFKIDGKLEFVRQWYDYSIDPKMAVINKLKRITGIDTEIISYHPILSTEDNSSVQYYACIVRPSTKINHLKLYQNAFWGEVRDNYNRLKKSDREGLLASHKWMASYGFQPLVMLKNKLLFK